jgi:predicted DNA binding CopG/RHH family protein
MSEAYDPNSGVLDHEEQEIEDGLDFSTALPESERLAAVAAFLSAAKAGRRPISARIDNADIEALKRIALREGMPYQTLLGSVIHKYVTGTLVDVNEARKVLAAK